MTVPRVVLVGAVQATVSVPLPGVIVSMVGASSVSGVTVDVADQGPSPPPLTARTCTSYCLVGSRPLSVYWRAPGLPAFCVVHLVSSPLSASVALLRM